MKGKLNNPAIKKEVARRLAAGEEQSSIARSMGFHPSWVCKFEKREDIREMIEAEQKRLLAVVPDAIENVKSLVREMKRTPKGETRRRELCYAASKDVLKSVGLMPTPVQSQILINLSQQTNTILSPVILKLLEVQQAEMRQMTEADLEAEGDDESHTEA